MRAGSPRSLKREQGSEIIWILYYMYLKKIRLNGEKSRKNLTIIQLHFFSWMVLKLIKMHLLIPSYLITHSPMKYNIMEPNYKSNVWPYDSVAHFVLSSISCWCSAGKPSARWRSLNACRIQFHPSHFFVTFYWFQ